MLGRAGWHPGAPTGPGTGLLLGSVGIRVAAHAPCPVVIVREDTPTATDRGRILVGIDGSAPSEAALGFAFGEAGLRHVNGSQARVHALYAWTWPAELPLVTGFSRTTNPDVLEANARRLVEQTLTPWQAKHPEIPVEPTLSVNPAGRALIDASADADLVVVGSHGHGAFTGMLLGSVSHTVLHGAHCPVVVCRPSR